MTAAGVGERSGEFVLRRLLGAGGAADVYLAEHALLTGRTAVVKRFRGPRAGEALRREAACAAALESPFIARLLGGDLAAQPPYLLYEHEPGETLRARLARTRTLSPPAALAVVEGVLRGLAHAHERGLVHGDVKPENVLVAEDGRVVLLDFGLGSATRVRCESSGDALVLSIGETGGLGALEGTLPYLAPERLQRDAPSPAADVFACGVLLFEALTGRLPAPGDVLSRVRPDAPEALDVFLARTYCHIDRRLPDAASALAWLFAELPAPPSAPAPVTRAAPARVDDVPRDRLRLAAYLGHRPALEALGGDAPARAAPADPTAVGLWVEGLGRDRLRAGDGRLASWARQACARAALAAVRLVLPQVEAAHAEAARRAVDLHDAWCRCPCERCLDRALRAAAAVSAARPAAPPLDGMAARVAVRRLARVIATREAFDRAAGDVARLVAILASAPAVQRAVEEALVPWALAAT